jgi:glycosyltransferase involved in cell wall biosynthesis
VWQGVQAVRQYQVNMIFATAPLPSGLLVGYWIHRISGKPFVVDLRDPWTTSNWAARKAFPFLNRLDLELERRVMMQAKRILVIEPNYIPPLLEKHAKLSADKFSLVTNGFDPEDFANIDPYPFDRFTIVHTGNFYGQRSVEPFLRGLSILLHREPDLRSQVQAVLVGKLDEAGASFLNTSDLGESVKVIDTVPHQISLRYLLGANLLLLIPGTGEGIMPGKVYEYLAARKPIFVIADKGVARDLILKTGSGIAVGTRDYSKIADEMSKMIGVVRSSIFCKTDNEELIQRFDRRKIAAQVAGIFNEILDSST